MKLTKRQRAKLISAEERTVFESMSHEKILAVHDLTHDLMMKACGDHRRDAFEAFAASRVNNNTERHYE